MTFPSIPHPATETAAADDGQIHQLSLSGGGFRAAFYHLGALHALAAQGRLRELKMLVTISGGSIAAGFFLQEWLAVARHGPVRDDALAQCALRAHLALFRKSRHNPRLRVMASIRALSSGLVRNEFGFSLAMARITRRWLSTLHRATSKEAWPAALPEWRIACSDYAQGNRCVVVIGHKGLPLVRSSTNRKACLVGCASALIRRPSMVTSNRIGAHGRS
jgi:predicted acylesterase/phospholipase RssA